jgi:hypothetical protein
MMTAAAPTAPRLAQLVGTCLSCLTGLAMDGVSRGTTTQQTSAQVIISIPASGVSVVSSGEAEGRETRRGNCRGCARR